jgi:chromosome partitioning protein
MEHQAMPKVIAHMNEKGGAGKTTTVTNIASCLHLKYGKRVLIVDHDPQASSSKWAALLPDTDAPGAISVVVMRDTLARDLPGISYSYDFVLIDGQPITDKVTAAAIKSADLVIVPIQPSQYDIWAAAPTISVIKQRQEITDGKPMARLLISRAIVGTVIERAARQALEEYEIPILKNQTHQRVAYIETVGQGHSVMNLPASDPARIEIEAITAEIMEILQ